MEMLHDVNQNIGTFTKLLPALKALPASTKPQQTVIHNALRHYQSFLEEFVPVIRREQKVRGPWCSCLRYVCCECS